ncbi:MAG TPA: energy transducer TonB [Dongiaceae bacterium]
MAVPWRGLALSVALHGALLLAVIFQWPDEPEAESLPADEAVVVSYYTPAGNPEAPAPTDAPPAEEIEQVQAEDEIESIEPEELPDTAPEEIAAVTPEPEILPEPDPLPPAPVAPPDIATLPPPETLDAVEPEPPEAAPKKPAAEPAKPIAQPAEEQEPAQANAVPALGAEPKPASTPSASREPRYADILLAWLQQKLIYPPKAERRGIEGTATVWIQIDSAGHVLDYRIRQSSGHRLLDREVEALIERADPMPPVPADEQAPQLEFTIPVVFDIK